MLGPPVAGGVGSMNLYQRARDLVADSFGADILTQQLEKSLEVAREGAADAAAPVSQFWDPVSLFMGREWLMKRGANHHGLTFFDLRRMAQNPVIASIIQTRLNQAASFMQPSTGPNDKGFRIVSEDDAAQKETETITAITQFVVHCGIEGFGDGSLEGLGRKVLRDSLVLDQCTAEVVPRRNKLPAYMVAVDGATIRRVKRSLEFFTPPAEGDPWYLQIVQDRVVAEYDYDQLMYGIRNPQTDISLVGYGQSELEYLFRTVATILNADQFNSSLLQQGGINKGLLVVKKPPQPAQFDAFKRDFREAYRNASKHWQAPVLGLAEGSEIDWLRLDESQRDMEYAQLFDWLVKQACGVYQIDPSEINWSIGAAGSRTTFESRVEGKIRMSQEKGLKPLLNFFADWITQGLIKKIDPRFRMEFVGVAEDRKAMAEVHAIEVKTTRTINEIREETGMEPLGPEGDIILDDTFVKHATGGFDMDRTQMDQTLEQIAGQDTDDEDNPDDDDITDDVIDDEAK